jgi:proteic killer suppression protein
MIQSFHCKETEPLFLAGTSRRFAGIKAIAERNLQQLDSAMNLEFLRAPPGNHLEQLSGNRKGQHSITINLQLRICLSWTDSGPTHVEIVDYH